MSTGHYGLFEAIRFKRHRQAMLLAEAGLNLNCRNDHGQSPLIYTVVAVDDCCRSRNRLVRLFLEAGADPNVADWKGRTALMHAAMLGYAECVKALLECVWTNTCITDPNGNTALMYAASHGHKDVIAVFLSVFRNNLKNLKLHMRNNDGFTALHLALRNGYDGCARLLTKDGHHFPTTIKGFPDPKTLDRDPTPTFIDEQTLRTNNHNNSTEIRRNNGDFTPLHLELRNGYDGCTRQLIKDGQHFSKTIKESADTTSSDREATPTFIIEEKCTNHNNSTENLQRSTSTMTKDSRESGTISRLSVLECSVGDIPLCNYTHPFGLQTTKSTQVVCIDTHVKSDEAHHNVSTENGKKRDNGLTKTDDGQNKTYNGISKIDDGQNETYKGISKIDDGQNETYKGISKIDDGQNETYKGISKIDDGQNKIYNGISKIDDGFSKKDDGLTKIDDGLNKTYNGFSQIDDGLSKIDDDLTKIDDGLTKIDEWPVIPMQLKPAAQKSLTNLIPIESQNPSSCSNTFHRKCLLAQSRFGHRAKIRESSAIAKKLDNPSMKHLLKRNEALLTGGETTHLLPLLPCKDSGTILPPVRYPSSKKDRNNFSSTPLISVRVDQMSKEIFKKNIAVNS